MPYFIFRAYAKLPSALQFYIWRAAVNAGAFSLAWDLADHANDAQSSALLTITGWAAVAAAQRRERSSA
jgi:hypothetical protein